MAFLKNKAAAILLGVSALCLPYLSSAQEGLENNELRRNINRASEDLRQMIAQQQFAAAAQKADELLLLDPNNSAAIIWKDYADTRLSGPKESRLEKLLGENITLSNETIRNAEDTGPIEMANVAPPTPGSQNAGPDSGAPSDDPFANDQTVDDPFASDQPNPFDDNQAGSSNNQSPDQGSQAPADTPAAVDNQPAPVAPISQSPGPSSSSGGTNWALIGGIVAGVVILLGLIFFILGRKKSKEDSAGNTGGAKRLDITKDQPTAPIHDAVTQAPAADNSRKEKPNNLTSVAPDQVTQSDQPTHNPEEDDTLYASLNVDDQVETSPELAFGELTLDDDKDDTQQPEAKEASQTGNESFSQVMFGDEDETKAPENQEEDIDPNEMSFNSMMFGGDDDTKTPPPSQELQKKSKEDSIDINAFEEDGDEENDNTFSSVMFGSDDETVAPGMGPDSDKKNDQSQGGESFSDVMFDQSDETVAPPGIGSAKPDPIAEEETKIDQDLSDTRKIEKPKDDDDDSIKL